MTVVLLGYLAMVLLGLLPLAALARLTGVEAEHTFLLPMIYALPVAAAAGVITCAVIGRVLGLLAVEQIHDYEERRRVEFETGRRRVLRHAVHTPLRSTASTAPFRFS